MRDIHCPKDIGMTNIFNGEDCEREQHFNNCYHCWTSAIAQNNQKYFKEKVLEQEPKIGHWIADVSRWGDIATSVNGYKCSECGMFNTDMEKFCSNCGAKMVEPQESEKINCKSTKCENCINHNYCDYESQKSEG